MQFGDVAVVFVWTALAATVTAVCAWGAALVSLRPLEAAREAHWTERARHAHQARQAVTMGALLPPLMFAIAALSSGASLGGLTALLVLMAAFWTSAPARIRVERAAMPGVTARTWLRGRVAWWLLMVPHLLGIVALAAITPAQLGWWSFALFGLALALTLFASLGGTLWVARAAGFARPAGPRLASLVAQAAARAGQQPPPTFEFDMPMANAFAWTQIGALGVTRGALEALSDDELLAVLAHELGHLAEPRSIALVRSLGMLALTPLVLMRPLFAERQLCPIAVLLWAMIGTFVAVRMVARKMEERADHAAHRDETDHGTYAQAMATLYEVNALPAVMPGARRVHPHLYDRLVAAGATPSWPRPAPPPGGRARAIAVVCLVVGALIVALSGCASDGAAPVSAAVGVACGTTHSCELRTDGIVRCWGAGSRGQLGAGDVVEASPPSEVHTLGGVLALGAGGDTTCAVTRSGEVYCWGRNDHGQVGDGTFLDRSAPTRVLALPRAVAVSVGYAHVCALDREARAWCWGFNGTGAITPGGARSIATPTLLPIDARAAQIIAGAVSTCVVDVDGRARCLGDAEALPATPLDDVRAVVLDAGWSCFAQSSALRCFGLRPGGTFDRFPPEGEVFGAFQASATSGGGTDHACAIDTEGSLRCLGKNDHGQLAGSMARGPEPVLVALPARVEAVAVGAFHTCAVAGGETWCWGANDAAQLGDGSGVTSLDPVRIATESGLLPSPP